MLVLAHNGKHIETCKSVGIGLLLTLKGMGIQIQERNVRVRDGGGFSPHFSSSVSDHTMMVLVFLYIS